MLVLEIKIATFNKIICTIVIRIGTKIEVSPDRARDTHPAEPSSPIAKPIIILSKNKFFAFIE